MTLDEFWSLPIQSKWVPIIIEGKPIKDRYLRDELLLRLDRFFTIRGYISNSLDLAATTESLVGMEDSLTGRTSENICNILKEKNNIDLNSHSLFLASIEAHCKDVDSWEKWWGKNPYLGESSIFTTEIEDEDCFFNLKTGKIKPTIRNVGRWPGAINSFKKEIDWFVKEFPQIDLTITFTDYANKIEKDVPIASLHLANGNYEIVKTKKYKNIDKLPFYSGIHWKRYWKDFLFRFIKLGHNIQKVFDEAAYDYWHNFKLIEGYYNNHSLLNTKKAIVKMKWWHDECLKKNGKFWKYLKETR